MTAAVYPSAKQAFLSGSLAINTGTIEIVAVDSSYAYSAAHVHLSDVTGTIQQSGSMTGIDITGGTLLANPVVLTSVTTGQRIMGIVGFKNTGTPSTSPLIWFDDGFNVLTNGGNVNISWDLIFEIPGGGLPGPGSHTLSPAGIIAADVLGHAILSAPGGGGGGGGVGVPVINVVSPIASSNSAGALVSGTVVATLTASNTPLSWSIVSPTGHFAIDNSGNLSVTTSGVSAITPSGTGAVETVQVQAANGNGSSTVATIRVTAYNDGALSAPTGTPQVPTLFSPYGRRPPWRVAGVDYYTGITAGTTLKDPTAGGLPAGTTYSSSSHQVTIGNANTTFDGWDLSIGNGIGLVIEAANAIVRNCKIVMGSNHRTVVQINEGGNNPHIYNCLLDESGFEDTETFGGLLYSVHADVTTGLTLEYCDIKNACSDFIDVGAGTSIVRYNLLRQDGLQGGHPDFQQTNPFSLPATCTEVIIYNTGVNTYGVAGGGGQGYGIGDNSCPVVGANHMDNNVMIANGTGNPGADQVSISYWAIIDPTSFQSGATCTCANNWVDIHSAYGFAYGGGSSSRSTFSNNINLVDGSFFGNTP